MFKDVEMFINYINVQVLQEVEKIKKAQKQGYTIIPNNENHLYMFEDENIQIFIDMENYLVFDDKSWGTIYSEYILDFNKEELLAQIEYYVLSKLDYHTTKTTVEFAKSFLSKSEEINKALKNLKEMLKEEIEEKQEMLDLINKD